MTINRTTLLDLPLPVTGTESGVWGDVTNNGLTQYLDIAIAGRNALTSANFTGGALTLATTEGDSSATNIAAGSAQYATLYVSSLAANSTITAPSSNRAYRVVNADATYTLTVKAAGQTGVVFPVSTSGTVVFNGTDYQIVGTFSTLLNVDNLKLDGNTISSTDTNGAINIAPNGTGGVVFNAGAVGTPSITFTGDTNTGIFSPAADTIAFAEGGAEAMRIDSSGNVGIGTTSPNIYSGGSYKYLTVSDSASSGYAFLTVAGGSGGGGEIDFGNQTVKHAGIASLDGSILGFYTNGTNSGTSITERMRINSSGNVGIGTTSPAAKLDVDGVIKAKSSFKAKNNVSNLSYYEFEQNSSNSALSYIGGDGRDTGFISFFTNDTERARITSGGAFLVGATTTTSNGNLTNAGSSAAVASASSTRRAWTQINTVSASNNATVDAWLCRDAAGNVFGNSFLVGHFYVYVNGASGANGFSGVYSIVTTGDGTNSATLSAVSTVTRGTSPVTSIQIANDGGSGAIKLTITYINNGGVVTGGSSTVTFVGQLAN